MNPRLTPIYCPDRDRYDKMQYLRCGKSGIKLPKVSLGLWHNFGFSDNIENGRNILRTAFDLGVTHFDLANNYGPPYGSAEENFGTIFKKDLSPYRDQLMISTKAGYDMWEGPYGNNGSKKHLVASLDQSLKRMGLDYVDIFYSHRPDPETPMEETMEALVQLVKQGKTLYVGLSNYNVEQTKEALSILDSLGCRALINQFKYSMFERAPEDGLLDLLSDKGVGSIAFSPLAQGVLTGKYCKAIPENSRARKHNSYLQEDKILSDQLSKVAKLTDVAEARGETMAQMALGWLGRFDNLTSVLIGASSAEQLRENLSIVGSKPFERAEVDMIDEILKNNY